MEIVALSSSSSFSADHKLRKSFKSDHLRRPIPLLKDFLLDDFSSCSSNGFKSFPRKAHCCAASVPLFLLDGDLKGRAASSASKRSRMSRSPSKAASATFSALHRASLKVLHKFLPYRPAVKSSSSGAAQSGVVRRGILPRSLSRRLSKTRFWKKTAPAAAAVVVTETGDSVTGRWKLFREFLEEKDPPPPSDKVCHRSAASLTSSSSGRNSSWDSSDFGSSVASSSSFSGNSVSSAVVSEVKKDSPLPPPLELEEEEEEVSDRVGVTVGGEESGAATTTECSKEGWQSEEKEQFSPVSVLDCPFHDDEEDTEVELASSSSYSPVRIGEIKRKHMHKARRFKSLSQIEPVSLDQRLAVSELKNHLAEPTGFGAKAEEMIRTMKAKYPTLGLGVDNLLSDFFMEKLEDGVSHDALNLADDWVNGREELLLGWEVVKGRNAYLRAMEKGEVWMKLEGEKQKVSLEVEVEIWSSLVEEMLLGL